MYTIYDYLKYYKDYDITEKPWNIIDNLLCACLVYMPTKSFKENMTFEDVYNKVKSVQVTTKQDFMAPKAKEMICQIYNSKRYKDLRFKNFVNRVDNKTQFGAITFTLKNIKVISYKGTDKSIVGWQENFRLAYTYPSYTQKLAIDYLKNNISVFDKDVYVVGHSKGGNLAMVSVMEDTTKRFRRIKQVINFDGPGFRKEEIESAKYKKLSTKLINIVPESSVVGMMLYNENYKVVTSSLKGISAHYPTSWNCYGSIFIEGKLSKLSKELNTRTTKSISKISEDSIREAFESIFKQYENKNTSKIIISMKEILNLVKTVKNLDSKTVQYISEILSSMLNTKPISNPLKIKKKPKKVELEIL